MKRFSASVLLMAALTLGTLAVAQTATPPAAAPPARPARAPGRISPHETISQVFDRKRDNRVIIVYGRPYSKDPKSGEIRQIWGTLVPWGKVWRMGSDEATLLIAQKSLVFGTTTVPAGAYTLDMIPNEDGTCKLIINKKIGQWGIPYTQAADELAQIDMTKGSTERSVDEFTIFLDQNPKGGGIIRAAWEKTEYTAAFTIAPD